MDREKRVRVYPVVRENARQLRRPLTPMEARLWAVLRNRSACGWKFRRQHPVGRFILDFYCAEAGLVVEVDGVTHEGREAYDAERTAWLAQEGYTVLRVTNQQVREDVMAVVEWVVMECERLAGRRE
jgi:very-short-patch-repair endonuclease